MNYAHDRMACIPEKVQKMVKIVGELEADFPGRHFTLDGHLVGSIGEVSAAYYYGIELYPASAKVHDGEVDGKKVQIKTTQRTSIVIKHEPDYLIVLFLSSEGTLYEVYNGPGHQIWDKAGKTDSNGNRRINVNTLMGIDRAVLDENRISAIHDIKKYHSQRSEKVMSAHAIAGTFYDLVYDAVRSIPESCVATYGQIAKMAGSPKASQSVGNALHENPDPETIPCHRIVNAKGELAPGFAFGGLEGQARLLQREGVEVINGRVDLSRYGYLSDC